MTKFLQLAAGISINVLLITFPPHKIGIDILGYFRIMVAFVN